MLTKQADTFVKEHEEETKDLLRTLGKIPAPSHEEDRRVAFITDWLKKQGAEGVMVDEAKNVIWPVGVTENGPVVVLMAHTDIVFPDTEELPMREEDGILYAPGIGDDTANLVNLLMTAKYFIESGQKPAVGLLFVANACEEGLGNLCGSRQIMKDYGGRVKEFISFDGGMSFCVNDAVGSNRYRIHIQSEGGHSYGAFGNQNAIACMADLISDLYQVRVPKSAKTTFNVGHIEGGTTVNSIAEECEILYEFRSESRECLAQMEDAFNKIIEANRAKGVDISVEVLGVRPCKGDVPEEALNDLTGRVREILSHYQDGDIFTGAASTDANIPLSQGVPAVTFGTYYGEKAHTRGEWVRLSTLSDGQRVALETLQMYLEN